METAIAVLHLTTFLWLSVMSVQVQEPVPEAITENFEFSSYDTTDNFTEAPNDNGMAIGDIPEAKPNDPPTAAEGKGEEQSAVEETPTVVAFPHNHKNFTPSQYLGDQEFPPYYDNLSPYQQQYKNYYEQKQLYNRKPIKFEENSSNNFYFPSRPSSQNLGDEKKKENFRVHRNPFPYVFENEKGQEQEKWYTNPGHVLVHEQPVNVHEHVFRGHQENLSPYFVFPYSYPHEEKFHNDEVAYYDHHHVKTEEKSNPWKKVFHVLTALVPLGLLLATLTPNVISINSTAMTKGTRQRSEDSPLLGFNEEDVLKLMKKRGVESIGEEQCENRIICELAKEGSVNTAGVIERGFWFLANQTPWDVAEKAGMNELFKTIKTGNCEAYKCHSKVKTAKSSIKKKLIRKHKITE